MFAEFALPHWRSPGVILTRKPLLFNGRFLRGTYKLIPLRAKPFELLLALVENQGRAMSKEELVNRVWPGSVVSDGNFHVNLDAVRKALGESGREPHFILRTAGRYKFVADVREVTEVCEQKADMPDRGVPN